MSHMCRQASCIFDHTPKLGWRKISQLFVSTGINSITHMLMNWQQNSCYIFIVLFREVRMGESISHVLVLPMFPNMNGNAVLMQEISEKCICSVETKEIQVPLRLHMNFRKSSRHKEVLHALRAAHGVGKGIRVRIKSLSISRRRCFNARFFVCAMGRAKDSDGVPNLLQVRPASRRKGTAVTKYTVQTHNGWILGCLMDQIHQFVRRHFNRLFSPGLRIAGPQT
mmetsp:Transcript_17339/g.31270  ORF Transcript_17339/g.31270 Transcript_17339/m.31270 type:complete len:225 (+) Transcript_17339:1599-2273(+)